MIILIIFLFCIAIFGFGLIVLAIADFFSRTSTLARQQKKITKAFDAAWNRSPRKQGRHLEKAEMRYITFLAKQKEKKEIKSFRKVKWLL